MVEPFKRELQKRPSRRAFAWRKRKGQHPRRDTIPNDLGDYDPNARYAVLHLPHGVRLDWSTGVVRDD